MTKKQKLELEITAVELWWKTFGKPGMSSQEDQLHMSKVFNRLKDKLKNCK